MSSKINDLTAVTSLLGTDITNIVRSPFAAGDDHKITMTNVFQGGALDWKTTGKNAFGSDGAIGSGRFFDASQTNTDFSGSFADPLGNAIFSMNKFSFNVNPSADIAAGKFLSATYETLSVPNTNSKNIDSLAGIISEMYFQGSGTLSNGMGLDIESYNAGVGTAGFLVAISAISENTGAGTTTFNAGGYFQTGTIAGSITDNYGLYVVSAFGTITNNYGLLIENQTVGGTANWAIQTGLGLVQFGDNLDIAKSFIVRAIAAPAVSAATQGKMYFDSAANKFKISENGGAYVNLLGSASGNAPADATYVTLSLNGNLTNERVLTGTANQVILTDNGANSTIVLSLPQSIAVTSTPQFATLTLSSNLIIQNGAATAVNFSSPGASQLRIFDATNVSGLAMVLSTASATLETISTANASLLLQNQTFTPGTNHSAVIIQPAWTAENFNHTALSINATQNGTNSNTFTGIQIALTKGTGATTLATLQGISIPTPSVTGTVTNTIGINISDQSISGSATSYAINIASQTPNATTTYAINLAGSGISNAIRFGGSANVGANTVNNIRILDGTNVGGLDFNLTTTSTTINTVTQNNASIILQNQTFTPGGSHLAVAITPTYVSENFLHAGLSLTMTQNGANTNILEALSISMIKATGATTLATMFGINLGAPTVTGTVTTSAAIRIGSQTNVNITTPVGILMAGTGSANCISWGTSALQYASAANNIRFVDSTNVGGLDFNLTTTNTTINTVTQDTARITFQNQTFTPGATHNAIVVSPTWVAEDFAHTALAVQATQNGANSNSLIGQSLGVLKSAAAGVLAQMTSLSILSPVLLGGSATASTAIQIASQTNGSVTTPRGIVFTTTGVANSIVWGNSAIQYANTSNNMRFADSTNARGIDLTLTAAGVQTITTFGGNLSLTSNTGIVVVTAAREEWAAGANVAAANDLTLGTDGNTFTITGNTQINAITTANWQAGSLLILKFTGTPTIKNNTAGGAGTAVIFLAGSADLVAANNTILGLAYDGTQWQECFRKAA